MLKTFFQKLNLKQIRFINQNLTFSDFRKQMYFDLNFSSKEEILFAYINCPQLRAIIDYKAKVFADNIPEILNSKGDTVDNHKIIELFENPNPLYSEGEFWETYSIQYDLFDIVRVWINAPVGMPQNATEMLILPGQNTEVILNPSYTPFNEEKAILYYWITIHGTRYRIFPEAVWTFSGTSVSLEGNQIIEPISKISTLKHPINNILAGYKVRNTIVAKGGPTGIYTNEDVSPAGVIPMRGKKDQLEQDLALNYGRAGQLKQAIITDARLKYQKIGVDIKELQIFEGIKEDKIAIADAYQFPILLLNDLEGSTFSNLESADKQFYTKNIIPFWNKISKSITKKFRLNASGEKWTFKTDQIESLQTDIKENTEVSKIQSDIILNLNQSVALGQMTTQNAIDTLIQIVNISEDAAKLLINEAPKITEPTKAETNTQE